MISRFLNFDNLIGTTLIKVLYFLGLAGIAIFALVSFVGGIAAMRFGVMQGLGMIVMSLVGAVVGVVMWRFMCELYLLFFRISDDIRDMKNHQLGIAPGKPGA
ncbi:DUF4282 domain-containing protein [Hyphomonas johnsonii]|jgi:uncharacterized membrane-anchored protein|uniref:DUF4282 domain-containing protein n=1 Tax=Hyphomonas johnsonii MHS-2 TaxID=1280950 RepID=A0A059FI05_9PROT|nr:DUF4282 domain-containing protein [Hyphomonas johnsonii]KCZ90103.1 hypothetical protein HJO_14176 [Hyphomonas johnsonii MHS-2]